MWIEGQEAFYCLLIALISGLVAIVTTIHTPSPEILSSLYLGHENVVFFSLVHYILSCLHLRYFLIPFAISFTQKP